MGNMKIKAKEKNGVVGVKCMAKHDMLTYDQAKKKGKEANFITHITAKVGDKVVFDVSTSQFWSKNPQWKFKFKGAKKGDELTITWTDLSGKSVTESKKIK
jgi:sulfur-oxidizing protein SoxZ